MIDSKHELKPPPGDRLRRWVEVRTGNQLHFGKHGINDSVDLTLLVVPVGIKEWRRRRWRMGVFRLITP